MRLALPAVVRAWDEPLLKRWLLAAHEAGLTSVEIGNIGALRLLADWGYAAGDVASDFTSYALNSSATRLWRELGVSRVALSVEDDLNNIRSQMAALSPAERREIQAIIYKDTPLFIAEACSLTALHNGCPGSNACGYRIHLKSRVFRPLTPDIFSL